LRDWNIYASEALFQAGISPLAPARELTKSQVGRLWKAIRKVLTRAIEGGSTVPLNFSGDGERDGLFLFWQCYSIWHVMKSDYWCMIGQGSLGRMWTTDQTHRAGGTQHLLLSAVPETITGGSAFRVLWVFLRLVPSHLSALSRLGFAL
jgi:hypothetical protein